MFDWLYRIAFRIQGSLFRRRIEREFEDEVREHLAQLTGENIARGMSPAEARRQALLRFGGPTRIREAHRENRGIPNLHTFLQDVAYAARLLRRSPGLTAIAVLTLAIGIGLNTTVFTLYDAVALRLLPVHDPASVVRLMRWYRDGSHDDGFDPREVEYVRDHARSFSAVVAAAVPIAVAVRKQDGGEARVAQVQAVSGNYFSMLGIAPASGRAFRPEEDAPGASPVVVVSHRYWVRSLLADPSATGSTIRLNGAAFTVLGIAPASFTGTGAPPTIPDLWIPAAMRGRIAPGQEIRFQILARRTPRGTTAQTAAEMPLLEKQLEAAGFTGAKAVLKLTANPATFFDRTGGGFEVFVWVVEALVLAVSSVLLIGCLNLVNLLLARAVTRRREIALRRALGAGAGRIVQQLCTETVLLAVLGGAAGLVLSLLTCRLLSAALESRLARFGTGTELLFLDLRPGMRVFLFAFATSLVTGILVGLAPARRAVRTGIASVIQQDTAALTGGRGRFRDALIAAQIAVCLTLLAGAGLLGRGVQRAARAEPGFETSHLFLLALPDSALGTTPDQRARRREETVRRLREAPGVSAAALSFEPPLLGHATGNFQPLASRVSIDSPESHSLFNLVSSEYFETLGIPLVRGRAFTAAEAARKAPLVVISELTAQRYWPGENPLGKVISVPAGYPPAGREGRTYAVIGVARSVRSTNLSKLDPAYLYFPASSSDPLTILLRIEGSPDLAAPLVRDVLRGMDGALATQMSCLNIESGPVQLQRLMTQAPAIFAAALGALGLLLATVGIYGVVAYLVTQRTREIGVRMALGASRAGILRLVFRQALKPVLWGFPFGLAGAAAVSALLGKMVAITEGPDLLFGVDPWSPLTFGAVLLAVTFVVWLASWLPARRALRVDPAASLRHE